MKKGVIIALASVGGVALLGTAGYFGLSSMYTNSFSYGTRINDTLCVGLSVDETNQLLSNQVDYEGITLVDCHGKEYQVPASAIDFKVDFSEDLLKIKQGQSPVKWGANLVNPETHQAEMKISFDEDKLNQYLDKLDCVKFGVYDKNKKVEIIMTADGYDLHEKMTDLVHPELVKEVVKESIYAMETKIDLKEKGCYEDLPLSKKDLETKALWNKIRDFQDFTLTYEIYDNTTETISKKDVCKWMLLDENGELVFDENDNIMLDEEKVKAYAVSLSDKYDTTGKPHEFKSTRGDVVTIEKSTYGNDIDEDKEAKALIEDFMANKTGQTREPIYKVKAWGQGEDDIGDTYIEVDMTNQHLYYYVEGKLELDCDVVTGNTSRKMGTPAAVCYVYGKCKNRILRGPNYATFVYYWMPVNGNIGLHDATWRKEFGGELYKTGGSHGCVNMPKAKAGELYDMVEIGTPCIIFY